VVVWASGGVPVPAASTFRAAACVRRTTPENRNEMRVPFPGPTATRCCSCFCQNNSRLVGGLNESVVGGGRCS